MKIGILTYHDINNYGAQLQASSLQRYIEAQGYEVEIIDYRPLRTRVRIVMTIIRPFLKLNISKGILEFKKRKMFKSTIKTMSRIGDDRFYTEFQLKKKLFNHYDLLICGSDELWNFQNYLGYLAPYILDFTTNKTVRKISYAASMGSSMPCGKISASMINSLNSFSNILVRDSYTLDYVKKYDLDAKRVLDPTFLFDFKTVDPKVENYMMISGSLTNKQVEIAVATARKMNLTPISVGCTYSGYESIEVNATPIEWISYIQKASFHFTSLFHGAVFSLKYSTPFAIYRSKNKKQKVGSLIECFNQDARIVNENATVERLIECSKLPFTDSYNKIFSTLVNNSKSLLLKSIATKTSF